MVPRGRSILNRPCVERDPDPSSPLSTRSPLHDRPRMTFSA
jgi:hypothetical protein